MQENNGTTAVVGAMLIYGRPDDSLHTVDYQLQHVDSLACHASATVCHPARSLRLKFWKKCSEEKKERQIFWQKKFDNKI
jgi:LmbE family N-acetylglucosaminyl deacetylase